MRSKTAFDPAKRLYRLKNFLKGNEAWYRYDIRLKGLYLGNPSNEWKIFPGSLGPGSVAYLFGAGTDISFDRELVEVYGLNAYIFDPTPKSVEYVKQQKLGPGFTFEATGLADFTGETRFFLPKNPDHVSATMEKQSGSGDFVTVRVERLEDIMKRFGHTRIDLLKMDIEGAEYGVIDDIIRSGIQIGQLLVEFHHRFPGVGIGKTLNAVNSLRAAGYRLFSVSAIGEEFSFYKPGFER